MNLTREQLQDKLRLLVKQPWLTEGDLMSLYTILIALPLSGGTVGLLLASLADDIDMELKTRFTEEK